MIRRLTIASTVNPIMMPTIMDSHGKPGIAGSTIGVEIVVELLVIVGVLTTVIVDTEVLTTVVAGELVVISDVEEALDDAALVIDEDSVIVAIEPELELALEVELELELALEVVLVACCPTTGGTVGSR